MCLIHVPYPIFYMIQLHAENSNLVFANIFRIFFVFGNYPLRCQVFHFLVIIIALFTVISFVSIYLAIFVLSMERLCIRIVFVIETYNSFI